MARARIEPEATDPLLPTVARAPSSAGVAPPHDAQTDTTEAGDMPPGLGAGQTLQSENLDPAAIVRRFVAGGEVDEVEPGLVAGAAEIDQADDVAVANHPATRI